MQNLRNIGARTFQTAEVEIPAKAIACVSDELAAKLQTMYPGELVSTKDAPTVKSRKQVEAEAKKIADAKAAEKQKAAKAEAEAQKAEAAAEAKAQAAKEAEAKAKAAKDQKDPAAKGGDEAGNSKAS